MLEWKDVANTIGKSAPLLGTLLGGPAGAAIGALVATAIGSDSTPDAVRQTLLANPDAAVKLRQIESDQVVRLRELAVTAENNRLASETQTILSVNTTMQSEAKADHWPTYSWRPFIGFSFGAYVTSLWVLPLCGVKPVMLSADLTLAIGAILGVASYFRGKAQADPGVIADNRG